MNILAEIVAGVLEDALKRELPKSRMQEMIQSSRKPINFIDSIKDRKRSVIAEIKRSSPSKGASAISVLTENRRFGGTLADFELVREEISIPLLRKDFLVSEYLILETRAFGADIALLIVAALDESQVRDYYNLVLELGMTPLVEVHNRSELEQAMNLDAKLIGINARNLKTLEVNPNTYLELLPELPEDITAVAESGIYSEVDASAAFAAGADVILVGEALVRSDEPALTLASFLK
jgi:indole-3-glycerol phosphate synthase